MSFVLPVVLRGKPGFWFGLLVVLVLVRHDPHGPGQVTAFVPDIGLKVGGSCETCVNHCVVLVVVARDHHWDGRIDV